MVINYDKINCRIGSASMNDKDIKTAYVVGNVLLNIIKWIILFMMVITIGLTLALIVFSIMFGVNVPIDIVNAMSRLSRNSII